MEVYHKETNTSAKPTHQKSSTGSSCKPVSHLPSGLVVDQLPLSRLFVPILSQEVLERQIPAPDFDVAQLWEEVRTKVVLIEQSSKVASGVFSYLPSTTELAEWSPQNPKLTIPLIGMLHSSNVATELHIEDISGIPQFTSGYPTSQEQTEDVRSSQFFEYRCAQFLDYRRTFELVNQVVLGYDEGSSGKLVRQPVPQDTSPDKEPLKHIRPKLHHLRFKESSEQSQYLQKRHISLDVRATFTSANYTDVLEPLVIMDFDNIGATFLSIFGGRKAEDQSNVNFWPDVERDSRSVLSMRLRMRYPADLDNAQKRALVQNLCHFFYIIKPTMVEVHMIKIQTLDPRPSASYRSQLNAKSRAGKSSTDRLGIADVRQSVLLSRGPTRPASAQEAKAVFPDRNSASEPGSLTINNAQASTSGSSAASHAVSPERFLEIVPCAVRTIRCYNLVEAEELKKFADLNVAIMKWGQAKFGMALAENLRTLRMKSKYPADWIMDEEELREYWGDVVDFEWQDKIRSH